MDGTAFVEAVETAAAEPLARFESPAVLDALSAGTREPARLLHAAAVSEHAAAETFHSWAADERDAGARGVFEAVAAQEDEHADRVRQHLDEFTPPTAPGPMHAYLRGRSATVERLATGLIARPLVSVRTHARLIAFFESRGGAAVTDLFTDLEADTAALIETGAELVERRCTAEGWGRARATATYCIRVAADDLADATLAVDGEAGGGEPGDGAPGDG